MIGKVTERNLMRMGELQSIIQSEGDDTEECTYAEYRTLLGEVMGECEPVVRMLAKSGLLVISVDLTEDIIKEFTSGLYESVTMDVVECNEGGCFYLEAGEVTGGTLNAE